MVPAFLGEVGVGDPENHPAPRASKSKRRSEGFAQVDLVNLISFFLLSLSALHALFV